MITRDTISAFQLAIAEEIFAHSTCTTEVWGPFDFAHDGDQVICNAAVPSLQGVDVGRTAVFAVTLKTGSIAIETVSGVFNPHGWYQMLEAHHWSKRPWAESLAIAAKLYRQEENREFQRGDYAKEAEQMVSADGDLDRNTRAAWAEIEDGIHDRAMRAQQKARNYEVAMEKRVARECFLMKLCQHRHAGLAKAYTMRRIGLTGTPIEFYQQTLIPNRPIMGIPADSDAPVDL